MPEELKDLIEKIQEDGVKAAEEKASDIENNARRMASEIVEKAKKEAQNLTEDARERIRQSEENSKVTLKQAGRDFLLALRKEIAATLDRIVISHVHKALTVEEMAKIITVLIKEHDKAAKDDIAVMLKKEDMEKLEKGFLNDLRNEIKNGITLKSSDEIQGGFMISYDSGKSYYDFTDKALAKYIAFSLRPKLKEILNESGV